jgi:hypothetical protein
MPSKKSIKIPVKKVKKSKSSVDVVGSLAEAGFEVSNLSDSTKKSDMEVVSKGLIKLSFSKFLKLVVNRDFDELLDVYKDEEVVLDADFLVELAAERSKDEVEVEVESGNSGVLTGVLIGILVSFILFLIFVK